MLQDLIDYGLSEKEANIYLICLKLSEATAIRIAELSNYPRTAVYDLLERLMNLGLISTVITDNKTRFIASDPKTLLFLLEEKKESIKNLLPELNKIHNQIQDKPNAEVFQGKSALLKIHNLSPPFLFSSSISNNSL
ncbi:MAG: TrmB family transcriptional regulator [Planctomycetes bacterium]|nr:TrmB family transcriptional regulator [Planctomycetota bacterium]